jgi:hypothetical protein
VDLLVVGLDLESGLEVHAGERTVQQWHQKGHNGDRTLVCAECYAGSDPVGGPRLVPLVPRGREGGARRRHFSHPPGMAPPGGRHHRETRWHAEAKQQIARWARDRGAQARVEAWTCEGRRRSDVAITLPGGGQIAVEVQLGDISDVQWLARHRDYARAGITDVWLWNSAAWVPRVMFASGQPGWILDLQRRKLGLIHARPRPAPARPLACGLVHWPPCPHDPTAVHWITLQSAQLTPSGIELPPAAAAELTRQAAASAAPATQHASRPQIAPAAAPLDGARPAPPSSKIPRRPARLAMETHHAFKYESRPPWTDPATWRHWCGTCGRTLTGAELDASPIFHIIPVSGQRTSSGQLICCHETRGGQPPPRQTTSQRPSCG